MKKFYSFLCLISIFQLFYSIEVGGIKFAISEKMANDVLYHFYPDINKEITSMKLENIHVKRGINIEDISVGIPNFTLDKIKFKFTEKGININISGLKAWIKATVYINIVFKEDKDIYIDIHEFNLNANLCVKTQNSNNKKIPYVQFTEPPTHTIDLDVDLENTLWFVDEAVEPLIKSKLKDAIDKFITEKSNKFINETLEEKLKNITVMPIDASKGLFIDYSLVDIKLKNGYIEINSYAMLFNEYLSETKEIKKVPLTLVPSISSIDNPNQLFISQYSINSALYTYFKTSPLSLKININSDILELLLPSITSKFENKKTEVLLETTDPPTLDFQSKYIEAKIFGAIKIFVEGGKKPIFVCSILILSKVEILTQGLNVSGKLHELSIKVESIDENGASLTFLFENVNKLISLFLSALNKYISQDIKFSLPIFFKNINVEHKSQYLAINYELKKEIYYSSLNSYLNSIQKLLKSLYFKADSESYRNVAGPLNRLILDMFSEFFKDNYLIIQYDTITKIISRIPDCITDTTKRRNIFEELSRELSKLNNLVNIPNSGLDTLGEQINYFVEQSIGMSQIPDNARSSTLTNQLNEFLARVICLIEQTALGHHSLNKEYFIWYDFDFSKCYRIRDPRN